MKNANEGEPEINCSIERYDCSFVLVKFCLQSEFGDLTFECKTGRNAISKRLKGFHCEVFEKNYDIAHVIPFNPEPIVIDSDDEDEQVIEKIDNATNAIFPQNHQASTSETHESATVSEVKREREEMVLINRVTFEDVSFDFIDEDSDSYIGSD